MSLATEHDIYGALSENFGFNAFKGTQEGIIRSVLAQKDTLVIMPTGGGKSLCYQLPAIMQPGTALIISPLIALMKNQVDLMRGYSSRDEIAHFLNSSLSRSQTKQVKQDLLDGHTKMLYVAPETLIKPETIEFLQQLNISFIAIDEAHCISEWGHDFRPEYRRIRQSVEAIKPNLPLMALTATATPKVREDIIKNLQLVEPDIFIDSFNRPNLYYEIRPKGKKDAVIKQIVQYVKQQGNKSGIIYCLNRKTTEEIAEMLQANNIRAAAYHAGLDAQTRSDRQDQFLMEDVQVIVATIAFGMGIDKPDVRFVLHYNMPKSLENYYQETGRSGRDGMEGRCIGFFSYNDMTKLEKFMRDKPVAEREIGGQHLTEVTCYAESASCRRRFLLRYFGEDYDLENCESCDNCLNPKERVEAKDSVLLLLCIIDELQENFDRKYLCNYLLGNRLQEIIDFKHDQLPLFGKGSHKDQNHWDSIINHAMLYNLVSKDIENYGVLKISEEGREFIKNPHSVKIALNHQYETDSILTPDSEPTRVTVLDEALFVALKDLRRKVAKRKGVPTYVVFQDKSLEEMATYYPTKMPELEQITGVSKGKALKFGKDFIEMINEYVEQNDIERASDFIMKSTGARSKDKIYLIQNIDKKIPLESLAKYLELRMDELFTEIEKIIDSGTKLNIDYYIKQNLDSDQQDEILSYYKSTESDSLVDAYRYFEEEYSEEELRAMRIKFIADIGH
jgi:ATP-dependent DNA helicase RecQ